jgi:hypothetical protein
MLQLNLKPETEEKFLTLLKSYKNEETFAEKLIEHQITELKKGIFNIELDLHWFEKKYSLSTKAFYEKWQSGELGDENEDFFIWSGIYEGLQRKHKKLEKLQ